MAMKYRKYMSPEGLAHFYERLKRLFVHAEEGKGLSENNFTDDMKSKLDSIDPNELVVDDDALTEEEIGEIINTTNQEIDG